MVQKVGWIVGNFGSNEIFWSCRGNDDVIRGKLPTTFYFNQVRIQNINTVRMFLTIQRAYSAPFFINICYAICTNISIFDGDIVITELLSI